MSWVELLLAGAPVGAEHLDHQVGRKSAERFRAEETIWWCPRDCDR